MVKHDACSRTQTRDNSFTSHTQAISFQYTTFKSSLSYKISTTIIPILHRQKKTVSYFFLTLVPKLF